MDKKYEALEVIKIIKNEMTADERFKLLMKLHEMYFDTRSDKNKAHQI